MVGTARLQAFRMGQPDRPKMLDLGQRVAGRDQISQVPVAARRERRQEPPGGCSPAPPGRRQRNHDNRQRRRHRQRRHLGPDREADGEPRRGERPAEDDGTAPGAVRRGGVEEDRDRGQDQRRGDEVVLRGPGLADDQGVALEDDRGRGDAERAAVVRPPDAPGGEERDRQPAEVEEQRERVALGEEDPDPVQQLRVLRVEPVGEDGLGVGVAGDRVALGEIDRVGHVVPEGVEVEDAAVEGILGGEAPVGEYDCDHADGDQGHEVGRGPVRLGGTAGAVSSPPSVHPRETISADSRRRGSRRMPLPRTAGNRRPATSCRGFGLFRGARRGGSGW